MLNVVMCLGNEEVQLVVWNM